MEHVVFFPGPDGSPAFRRTSSLDDAVRFVEHLRNTEGVAEVSVHALSEVPLAFRAYYRVEMPTGAHAAVEVPPQQPAYDVPPIAFEVVAPTADETPAVVAGAAPHVAAPELEVPVAEAAEPAQVAEPAEPEVAPVAEVATPFVTPEAVPTPFGEVLAPVTDIVPGVGEQPALNGRRSLGFFSH
jgi:hypothetical protein